MAQTEQYNVRLLFQVEATDPINAVSEFVGQIADNGLATWVYRVTHGPTGVETIVHPESRQTWTPEEFETYMASRTDG